MDIFDFEKYHRIYKHFAKFFSNIELYLRTALYIDYVYSHDDPNDIILILEQMENEFTTKLKLENLTDVLNQEELLMSWYKHFNPINATYDHIEKTFISYYEAEDVLWNRLYKKYVDPNWDTNTSLWFNSSIRPLVSIHHSDSPLTKYNIVKKYKNNIYLSDTGVYIRYIKNPNNLNDLITMALSKITFKYYYEYSPGTEELYLLSFKKNIKKVDYSKFILKLESSPKKEIAKGIIDDLNNIKSSIPNYKKIKVIKSLLTNI